MLEIKTAEISHGVVEEAFVTAKHTASFIEEARKQDRTKVGRKHFASKKKRNCF